MIGSRHGAGEAIHSRRSVGRLGLRASGAPVHQRTIRFSRRRRSFWPIVIKWASPDQE
jgi:hypothetical protein